MTPDELLAIARRFLFWFLIGGLCIDLILLAITLVLWALDTVRRIFSEWLFWRRRRRPY